MTNHVMSLKENLSFVIKFLQLKKSLITINIF
jgi:hypothetical protein